MPTTEHARNQGGAKSVSADAATARGGQNLGRGPQGGGAKAAGATVDAPHHPAQETCVHAVCVPVSKQLQSPEDGGDELQPCVKARDPKLSETIAIERRMVLLCRQGSRRLKRPFVREVSAIWRPLPAVPS